MGTAGIGEVVLVHVFTQPVPAGVLARYRRGGQFAGAAGRDARRARKPFARPTGRRAGSRVSHWGRRRAAPSIPRGVPRQQPGKAFAPRGNPGNACSPCRYSAGSQWTVLTGSITGVSPRCSSSATRHGTRSSGKHQQCVHTHHVLPTRLRGSAHTAPLRHRRSGTFPGSPRGVPLLVRCQCGASHGVDPGRPRGVLAGSEFEISTKININVEIMLNCVENCKNIT